MPKYSRKQIMELEDVIINKLSPMYNNLEIFLEKGIEPKKTKMMLRRIEDVVAWIRNLK